MLTLIPWMFTGLTGVVITAMLAAAQWYLWDSRHRTAAQLPAGLAQLHTTHHEDVIQVPSASGRDVVVTLAAPMPVRNSLAAHQAAPETARPCA